MMNAKETAAFWRKVNRIPDGCWLWTASKTPPPWEYGQLWAGGKLQLAHRLCWEMHHGEIPKGSVVCHSCDTPACVCPDHLFLGTQFDNMGDCSEKGRYFLQQHPEKARRGEGHPEAKLTEEQVRAAFSLVVGGLTHREVGAMFGVTPSTIGLLANGRTWRHLRLVPLEKGEVAG